MIKILIIISVLALTQSVQWKNLVNLDLEPTKACKMAFLDISNISIQQDHVLINLKDSHFKSEMLKEFLFSNYLKNFEIITNGFELRKKFKVIKPQRRISSLNISNLFTLKEKSKNGFKICDWTWTISKRENRYPFIRPIALCSNKKCELNIDTIYESKCSSTFSLMPSLYREELTNSIEKWVFYLEEVPIACECIIKYNSN
jgi:hypothetical protein